MICLLKYRPKPNPPLFLLLDSGADGVLTMDELISQVPRLRGAARGIDLLALRRGVPVFRMLEENKMEITQASAEHEDRKIVKWSTYPEFGSQSMDLDKYTWSGQTRPMGLGSMHLGSMSLQMLPRISDRLISFVLI